ncbi:hypothetical protein C1645_791398 [Glomus cerebriforme]|uniref:Uncharacterized protein n=1 Tax=Glomus cerebriforme TaxID=658196 RepID=A0A397SAL3_9GLOM|nr:hypothetical protein C1645_791398 [Glomus cerebriforme]
MQLNIKYPTDLIFEWIPYNLFSNITKISEGNVVILYSVKWKDGSLYWDKENRKYIRKFDKMVDLICLNYSTNVFLNKAKEYLIDNNFETYGISQNPKTKDYILVLQNGYCMKYGKTYCLNCNEKYTNARYKWCKQCLISDLNLSKNEKLIVLFKKCN